MPYRIDLAAAGDDALDRLVDLGAIDVDRLRDGGIAALMPDCVRPEEVASALAIDDFAISPAIGRDAGSVWVLGLRPVRVGRLQIVPAGADAEPGALRLTDAAAFGTGQHPTTALCLEALQDEIAATPDSLLDVGTGSGVLAIAALMLGVPTAVGIDIDPAALATAAENARVNGVGERLRLMRGGPEMVSGRWPLVVANVLAAPLVEMAPALVRRVGHHGHLVLSGIPTSAEADVDRAYRHLGLRRVRVTARGGWVALVFQATW